jgi:hypothetical protein
MSNGDVLHRVNTIQQRGDNTVEVYVQTDSFKPGQEVEVSVYLSQGDAYAIYNQKKYIPYPDPKDPISPRPVAVLHVELPATVLDPEQDVTVVTRVAEVWPTVLQKDSEKLARYQGVLGENMGQGLKAVWTYQDDAGKGSGDSTSPSSGNAGSATAATPQK